MMIGKPLKILGFVIWTGYNYEQMETFVKGETSLDRVGVDELVIGGEVLHPGDKISKLQLGDDEIAYWIEPL